MKDDFKFVASEYFPDNKFKQQNLSRSQKSRIYNRIFNINNYNSFSREISHQLHEKAIEIAAINIESRYIFDECIDYLSRNKTAIPSYSQLQRIISTAVNTERQKIIILIDGNIPKTLSSFLDAFFESGADIVLSEVRQSAKNFAPSEINKELIIFHHLKPCIDNINSLIAKLTLSLKNLEYYASLVNYYTVTKLQRFDMTTRQLYLLCYLQLRYRNINEHLAEAFIYHFTINPNPYIENDKTQKALVV